MSDRCQIGVMTDQFIMQNKSRIDEIFMQKILKHPDAGAISCYMISNGAMNIEQQHTADSLFATSVSEVAKELGVDQEEDIQDNDDG